MLTKNIFVIGTDLSGRKCPVACIRVPNEWTRQQALSHIRNITHTGGSGDYKPYAVVDEIEGRFPEEAA